MVASGRGGRNRNLRCGPAAASQKFVSQRSMKVSSLGLVLYAAYQTLDDLALPLSRWAALASGFWGPAIERSWYGSAPRRLSALWQLLARSRLNHVRPAFGIERVDTAWGNVAVTEEAVLGTPFATLLRFRKQGAPQHSGAVQPRVLLVAPLSGHFATLLRPTVATLLPEHDVYITDWHNARHVPLAAGPFGFDDYVDHVIGFLEALGPGAHVMAVCQPCVQVLAAVALMAEDRNPATPASMTLMAGPIDARVSPTAVNHLARGRPISWFERNVIDRVPPRFAGRGRRVYPGFVQLASFVAMNPERHLTAQRRLGEHLARGELAEAAAIEAFYDEYCAVLDLPAEFYLETLQLVFQEHHLAEGRLRVRGRRVDPGAIRRTALLTVEGERDDICGLGQTMAAQELCGGLKPYMKRHHLQLGAGHYGVFGGRKWTTQIYPLVQAMIAAAS